MFITKTFVRQIGKLSLHLFCIKYLTFNLLFAAYHLLLLYILPVMRMVQFCILDMVIFSTISIAELRTNLSHLEIFEMNFKAFF